MFFNCKYKKAYRLEGYELTKEIIELKSELTMNGLFDNKEDFYKILLLAMNGVTVSYGINYDKFFSYIQTLQLANKLPVIILKLESLRERIKSFYDKKPHKRKNSRLKSEIETMYQLQSEAMNLYYLAKEIQIALNQIDMKDGEGPIENFLYRDFGSMDIKRAKVDSFIIQNADSLYVNHDRRFHVTLREDHHQWPDMGLENEIAAPSI